MKYFLTITLSDGGTLNAWAETETQGRLIGDLLVESPGVERIELHKTSQRGPHKLLVEWGVQ